MQNTTKTALICASLLFSIEASAFSLGDAVSAASTATQATKAAPRKKTQSSDLTNMLVNQLDVTPKQASGGVGSILSYAKSSLPQNDYTKLASAIPNASSLVAQAPKAKSSLGSLGSLGSKASSAMGMAALGSQFSSLGLNSSMVSKFVPVIMDYLKGSGSTGAMGVLSSLF